MAFKKSLMNRPPRKYAGAYQTLGDFVYLTAYFTEPSNVCDEEAKLDSNVVGDKLVFLVGTDKYVSVPLEMKNIEGTKWVKGYCVKYMGTHYWYDISVDMNCDDFFPFIMLYDPEGKLIGFSPAIGGVSVDSPRVEHPPPKLFEKPHLPTCASKFERYTTQHFYFTPISLKTHGCGKYGGGKFPNPEILDFIVDLIGKALKEILNAM